MNHLPRKDALWKWSVEEEKAFQCSKELLTSSPFLVHFDPILPLILACDASEVSIGAMLANKMPDGGERPIKYVSRFLTKAERILNLRKNACHACLA